MRVLILIAMTFFMTTAAPAQAGHGEHHVFVTINGLVCDFCARAMEKVFSKKASVAAVKVDLSTKIVTIDLKPNAQLGDDEVKSGVTDAGYTIVKIDRD